MLELEKFTFFRLLNKGLTLIRVASQPTLKERLVGIFIPTDVGLLIPTPQFHAFGTVKKPAKTLDFESSVEVLRELRSVYKMNQL